VDPKQAEAELQREVMRYEHDPLGFILAAYPWGEGPLTGEHGPRAWQREAADEIGRRLRAGMEPFTGLNASCPSFEPATVNQAMAASRSGAPFARPKESDRNWKLPPVPGTGTQP
jgi:hypothetical protein